MEEMVLLITVIVTENVMVLKKLMMDGVLEKDPFAIVPELLNQSVEKTESPIITLVWLIVMESILQIWEDVEDATVVNMLSVQSVVLMELLLTINVK